MKISESRDAGGLKAEVSFLIGRRVVGAVRSKSGVLRLRFEGDSVGRNCFLAVYSSAWRIDGADSSLAASQDAPEFLTESVGVLEGRRVEGVTILSPSLDTTFELEGVRLRIFPAFTVTDEQDALYWRLVLPSGDDCCAGPGAAWSIRGRTP